MGCLAIRRLPSNELENNKKVTFQNGLPDLFLRKILSMMSISSIVTCQQACKKFLYLSMDNGPRFNSIKNFVLFSSVRQDLSEFYIDVLANKKFGNKLPSMETFVHISSILKFRNVIINMRLHFTEWTERLQIHCDNLAISRPLDYQFMLKFFKFTSIEYCLHKNQSFVNFVNHPQVKLCDKVAVQEVMIDPIHLYDQIKHLKSVTVRSPLRQNFPTGHFLCPLIRAMKSSTNKTIKRIKIESCRTVIPDYSLLLPETYLLYKSPRARSEIHAIYLGFAETGFVMICTTGSFGFAQQEIELFESIEAIFATMLEKLIAPFPGLKKKVVDISVFYDEFMTSSLETMKGNVDKIIEKILG